MKKLTAALSVAVALLLSTFAGASPAGADHYPAGGDGYCYAGHTGYPSALNTALSSPTVAKVTTYKDGTVKLTCVFTQVPRSVTDDEFNSDYVGPTQAWRSGGSDVDLCSVEGSVQNPFAPGAYVERLVTPGGVWKLTCTVPPGGLEF